MNTVFRSTGLSVLTHVFGALTCATCWTIFGPSLALLFGSSGVAFLAAVRPLAPFALVLSAIGLGYSVYQLSRRRHESAQLPYRLAALFTVVSVIGWGASAAYTVATFVRG